MDQYFNQMEKIIKEKKTSSRIRFMLQDVIDLRRVRFMECNCWGLSSIFSLVLWSCWPVSSECQQSMCPL